MTATLVAPTDRRWKISRTMWLLVAVAGAASAIVLATVDHLGWWPIVLFAIAPDLSFVAGVGQSAAPGQLPTNAVPVYNLVHRPLLPMALIAATSVGPLSVFWLAAGLAWLTHIAVDRVTGYGLRTKDGWLRG